ncbi:MAG: GAF domain-containing protein [Anaerolineae bacterium]
MLDALFTPISGELQQVSGLRTALLDALFDQMPIGMAVIDRDLTLLRVNDTWRGFLERYAPLSSPKVHPGTKFYDLFPDEQRRFEPFLNEAFSGKILRREAVAMRRDGVISYWDVVMTPVRAQGEIQFLLIVVVDASDRVFANRLLEEKEAQYRGIFEATSDGVIILAASGRIVEANPAACAMHGYTYDEMIGMDSTTLFTPGQVKDALVSVLRGEAVDFQGINIRKNGERFNVEIRATRFMFRGESHMLSVVRDVTERVQAYQMLEQRVEERTHELSTLLRASNNIALILELETLLDRILDEMKLVIDYNGAAILTLRGDDTLDLMLYRGPIPRGELRHEWSVGGDYLYGEVIHTYAPIIVADVYAESAAARAYRQLAGSYLRYVRSWMGVPLIVRQRVVGMLSFDSQITDYFTPHLANLAMAFANQAAVAMDNARLYQMEQDRLQESQRRTLVAEGMREILNVINSSRSLEAILDFIVAQAGRLLGTNSIALFGYQPDEGLLTVQTSIGLDDDMVRGFRIRAGRGEVGRGFSERRPAIIPDLSKLQLQPDDEQRPYVERMVTRFTALLAVPLVARDAVYGELVLYYPHHHDFTEEEIRLVISVCDQAALAIENARLRAQAEAAVTAERSRLARELH